MWKPNGLGEWLRLATPLLLIVLNFVAFQDFFNLKTIKENIIEIKENQIAIGDHFDKHIFDRGLHYYMKKDLDTLTKRIDKIEQGSNNPGS